MIERACGHVRLVDGCQTCWQARIDFKRGELAAAGRLMGDLHQIDVERLARALHETEWLCNHGYHSTPERPPADDHDLTDAKRLLETYERLA